MLYSLIIWFRILSMLIKTQLLNNKSAWFYLHFAHALHVNVYLMYRLGT